MRCVAIATASAMAILLASCASGGTPTIGQTPTPDATAILLPTAKTRTERERNRIINEAVRVASDGCGGAILSSPPQRILAALTSAEKADGLINTEATPFTIGPGGAGAPTVWVIAVEGRAIRVADMEHAITGEQAFVFVIHSGVPIISGCIVREAPTPTRYLQGIYGGFEFDVLLDVNG